MIVINTPKETLSFERIQDEEAELYRPANRKSWIAAVFNTSEGMVLLKDRIEWPHYSSLTLSRHRIDQIAHYILSAKSED